MMNHTSSLHFSLLHQQADKPRQDTVTSKINKINKMKFYEIIFLNTIFVIFVVKIINM